jgi:hypothetical protein
MASWFFPSQPMALHGDSGKKNQQGKSTSKINKNVLVMEMSALANGQVIKIR